MEIYGNIMIYHRSSYIPMISPWYFLWLAWNIISPRAPNLGATFDLQKTEEMPSSSVKQYGHLIMSLPRPGERWAKRCEKDLFHIIYFWLCHHFHTIYDCIISKKNGRSIFSILFHVENDDIAIWKRLLKLGFGTQFSGLHPVGQRSGLGQFHWTSKSNDSDAGRPSKYNHISISIRVYIYMYCIYILYTVYRYYILYIDIIYCI